ncbi:MAG: hypothetical protein HYT03_00495 [Candidatus Harrisonbacteria bacterium]|nr:hypothetical protein [Candidatus Harrisonbacteria bacterium]
MFSVGRFALFLIIAGAGIGVFWFIQQPVTINVDSPKAVAEATSITVETEPKIIPPTNTDIEPQKPLENPPEIVKAVYATSWSASNEKKLNYLINLIKQTELNAIVIDIKDYSGYIVYNTDLELPKKYDAVELRIPNLNKLIKRLHDEDIYIIGRISAFQDQRYAIARPDLALHSSSTGAVWKDFKGLTWMDQSSREVWDYNLDIAEEIVNRGFDEINFDYIRFASDGNVKDISYPFWDEKTLKIHVMRDFFKYMRWRLPDEKISADLFGLVTVNTDGLGIGQHLEFALPYFDVIAPMVYPSHYAKTFIGFQNPAEHPYEVVKYSMDTALYRAKIYEANLLEEYGTSTPLPPIAKFRPWLQDFDLGANYDAEKVKAQINAWDEAATNAPQYYDGWMIWNPSNVYTKEALIYYESL